MEVNPTKFTSYHGLQTVLFLEVDAAFSQEFFKGKQEEMLKFLFRIQELNLIVKERFFVTDTFVQAMKNLFPDIIDGAAHIRNNKPSNGIIFTPSGFTLYSINPPNNEYKACLYGFNETALTTYSFIGIDGSIKGAWWAPEGNNLDNMKDWTNTMLAINHVATEWDINKIIIQPGQKSKPNESDTQHLFNETKYPITILHK
jgi:hypothetical protein